MSDFFLVLLWLAVAAGVCAIVALPFLYIRGMRQIDEATRDIFHERDRQEAASNVRVLRQWELARRIEKARRSR
jgi:hypothetical protein